MTNRSNSLIKNDLENNHGKRYVIMYDTSYRVMTQNYKRLSIYNAPKTQKIFQPFSIFLTYLSYLPLLVYTDT